MPTYDYECDHCGHTMELLQGVNEKVKKKCPECGKLKLQRLIGGGAGFIFKGPGFYTTDYRSKEYKTAAAKDKDQGAGKKAKKTEKKTKGD